MRSIAPIIFALFFICSCYAKYPKRYVVDLDRPADERWNEVVHDHLDLVPSFIKAAQSYVPKYLLPIAFFVAKQLNHFFPHEYAEEIKGIARESGLPLGYIVSMNILYDILAFDRKHILQMGCTSIVAQNGDGIILHGRNLDYGVENLLKNVTILVDFVRLQQQEKVIVYSGVTFAMSTTLLTGQNEAFSISLNARYSGPYIYNILMEFFTKFRTPVGFLLREVLSSSRNYTDAVQTLSNRHLFSPSYIIIGGRKKGEGAIISRDRMRAADVMKLSDHRWFLVQTNYDHWRKDMDKRRITAVKMLKAIGRDNLDVDIMRDILKTFPVKNNLTLFSTVMSARYPSLMKKTTFIWS